MAYIPLIVQYPWPGLGCIFQKQGHYYLYSSSFGYPPQAGVNRNSK